MKSNRNKSIFILTGILLLIVGYIIGYQYSTSKQALSDDEAVINAAKNRCESTVNAKFTLMHLDRVGSPDYYKKVVYSKDKLFAKTEMNCSPKEAYFGGSESIFFKKVNGVWVYVDEGQQDNPVADKRFGIPQEKFE